MKSTTIELEKNKLSNNRFESIVTKPKFVSQYDKISNKNQNEKMLINIEI